MLSLFVLRHGGQFTINKGLKVGYIAQENGLDEDKTIWDEMLTVFNDLIEKNKKVHLDLFDRM